MSKYAVFGLLLQAIFYTLLIASDSRAQLRVSMEEIFLTIDLEEATLEETFRVISEKTNFKFAFDHGKVHLKDKVTTASKEESLDNILRDISRQANLQFRRVNDNIFVTRKKGGRVVEVDFAGDESMQGKTITGKVTAHEDGEGLPGVNVIVKGTSQGTVTDVEGNYSLEVPGEASILVFSSVGYVQEEIMTGNQTVIDVSMVPDITALDEIVVVGYGTQEKRTVTGAVSTVDNDQIAVTSEPTLTGALIGKVSGVSTRQSGGRPGQGAALQIRNLGAPLYVIDGIQKDVGQFNNLDAADIESITVLKDASAAVYGIQASNGVILVTTKTGKRNMKNQLNVSYRTGWQNFTQFPDMMNAAQWVDHMVERDMNLFGSTAWTREEYDKWQKGTEPGYESFDWKEFIIRENAPQSHFNINTIGGSDKVSHYVSYSSTNQKGMFDGYGFKRNNIQTNVEADLVGGLKLGVNINGRVEEREGVMTNLNWDHFYIFSEAIFRNRPTERPYANDNPLYPADNGNRSYVNTAAITRENSGGWVDTWRVLQGNMKLTYESPIEGLNAELLATYYYADNEYDGQKYETKLYSYVPEDDEYLTTGGSPNRYKLRRYNSVEENMYRAQINYNGNFTKHKINAVVAAEMNERLTPGYSVEGKPTTDYLSLMKPNEFTSLWNGYGESARAGYVGRVNYIYADRYIIELSGRYDGSYKFLPENRWGFFPAVSFGYRISEENYWKNLGIEHVIDDFKIRGSYGKMGDDSGIGAFDYYDGYNFDRGRYILKENTSVTGIEQRGLPATNISWIETINFNVGFDLSMFESKVLASADFFTRKREGLLAHKNDIVIPEEVGFDLPRDNLESDMNIGWDASITWRDHVSDFNYEIGGVIGFSRRKTVNKYNPQFATSMHYWRDNQENRWQGAWWGYLSDGQFTSQEQIDNWEIDNDGRGNRTMRPGDIIYKDLNGDGRITWDDTRPLGYSSGLPLLNFGINLNMQWKGFTLYMLWQGAGKYNYYRNWEVQKPAPGDGNSPAFLSDRWRREDPFDVNSAWIPGKYPSTGSWSPWQNNNYDRPSDFWLHNINYIRLKEFELGYNLPDQVVDKLKVQSFRVFLSGTNLLTFDNIDIVDPEITATNAVTYPQVKTVNVGFKLTL
ncbi:MAG: SusC/RagA family TonB-linked outer membrane protein [Cytophagales bacterium]|nr:SusC/RagA family TonB-linked outer membrane protein [Cytophagales bacterium]